MEPPRGEGYPSGQRRGSAAPGGGKVPLPDHKLIKSNNAATTTVIHRVDIAPHGVETPPLSADSYLAWAHVASATRESFRSGHR